jgi:hypothetical protein
MNRPTIFVTVVTEAGLNFVALPKDVGYVNALKVTLVLYSKALLHEEETVSVINFKYLDAL